MSAVCEYQAQIKPSREKWALNPIQTRSSQSREFRQHLLLCPGIIVVRNKFACKNLSQMKSKYFILTVKVQLIYLVFFISLNLFVSENHENITSKYSCFC